MITAKQAKERTKGVREEKGTIAEQLIQKDILPAIEKGITDACDQGDNSVSFTVTIETSHAHEVRTQLLAILRDLGYYADCTRSYDYTSFWLRTPKTNLLFSVNWP